MILLDYSQCAISNLHQQLKQGPKVPGIAGELSEVNPDMLRHMILNSIRKNNRQFGNRYGDLVICTDNHNYWRKSAFRYYKANRKKDRDSSGIDWPLVFQTLGQLKDELRENFPYKIMDVPMAEADDIIGVIAKHYHPRERILILSGDKDFKQLQVYPGVQQYNPIRDEFMIESNPAQFLKEHIIRGDKGDGVPNFLSADEVFVVKGRQASIFDKKLEVWLTQQPEEFCTTETMLKNYNRNKMLVDLTSIPEAVEAAILAEFDVPPVVSNKGKIFSYLVKNRMKELFGMMGDF